MNYSYVWGNTHTHLSQDIAQFKQNKYITIIHLTKDATRRLQHRSFIFVCLLKSLYVWIVYSPGAVDMFKNIEKPEKSNIGYRLWEGGVIIDFSRISPRTVVENI